MKYSIVILFLVVFFTAIGVIFSYPLILHFNDSIPYTHAPAANLLTGSFVQGDHLALYYIYWLIKDYFMSSGQHLFREPYMFYIKGWPRPFEPRGLPSSLLFLLFSPISNITAYNIVIILSFLLSGIFTFLLANKYLKHTVGALTASIIFTVSPFRISQLFGAHPTGIILFWIPLIIYLYELLWEKRKWFYGCFAGISIFFMCIEEHHMGYYTALFTIVFWLYKFIFCNKKKPLNLVQFALLLLPIAAGWFLSGVYMLYVKSIVITSSIAGSGRTFDEIKLYAPFIKHIFLRINSDGEKYIYIGIIPSVLLLIGMLKRVSWAIKNKKQENNLPYLFYFCVFIFTLLLSLGPNLRYFPIYKICYKTVPFFYFPRSPARIFMYTILSMSLLSGYTIKTLQRKIKTSIVRHITSITVIIFLCLEFHTYPKIGLCSLPKQNSTYSYIKNSFPENPVLEIPIWPGESSWASIYQYYTTICRIPIVNGYSPFVTQKYVDEIFWPLVSINMGMINREQYKLLKKLNIKYINLHEEAYPQKVNPFPFKIALENLKKSPYLKYIFNDGPVYLFQVLDKPQEFTPNKYTISSKTGVFYECETMPHRIGKITQDNLASENTALYADSAVTEPQHLLFGPWQLFPPGQYKILFRIKTGSYPVDNKVITIEVTTDKGNKKLVFKDILNEQGIGEYKDYLLHFGLDTLTELEFRIIYYGGCPVWADYIYLLCEPSPCTQGLGESENDPIWHYEAEDLFHIGREKDGAVYADPGTDPPGDLVFGPYRRYPKGRYRIGFNIKAGASLNTSSAILKIAGGHSDKALASMELSNIPIEYTTYWLEINLNKPAVLEFKVEFLKKVPIYVDSITIE